jgi:hypothetical protein
MRCSKMMMRYTGYLHVVALFFAIYGTYAQIDAVRHGKPFSAILAVSLTMMLLLRVPNQICVALTVPHGWYSVLGTILGAAGFTYLAYVTYQQEAINK